MRDHGVLQQQHIVQHTKITSSYDVYNEAELQIATKRKNRMPLSELARVLERQNFVFVDGSHIVSSYDLLEFMQDKV